MSRLFDNYIIIDWSAASAKNQGKDSIWIGILARDVRFQLKFQYINPPTRTEAYKMLCDILHGFVKRGNKTLVGFDFGLAYPQGTAAKLGLKGTPWLEMQKFIAKEMIDKPDNSNNRFSVASKINRLISGGPFPFWGAPPRDVLTTLQPVKSGQFGENSLPEFRLCEIVAKANSPMWKLYAPGSVGSQSLTGIPYVRKLANDFPTAKIWPFETGFKTMEKSDLNDGQIIICEIYPSMLKTKEISGEVKDLTQVRSLAEYFANLDEIGNLGQIFGASRPNEKNKKPAHNFTDAEIETIESEEGWILGI